MITIVSVSTKGRIWAAWASELRIKKRNEITFCALMNFIIKTTWFHSGERYDLGLYLSALYIFGVWMENKLSELWVMDGLIIKV